MRNFENYLQAELYFTKNELTDTITPSIAVSELTIYVLEMLAELNEYEQKNKLNDRMVKSKNRLLKMLEIISKVFSITDTMQSLKLNNRELFADLKKLQNSNEELLAEFNKIVNSLNF